MKKEYIKRQCTCTYTALISLAGFKPHTIGNHAKGCPQRNSVYWKRMVKSSKHLENIQHYYDNPTSFETL